MTTVFLAINLTLLHATPLILAGLGGVISEKSGVVNLALEGIMTVGAFAGAAVAIATGNVWAGFFAAGVAGAMLALLHAVATVTFKADQTISGVALNFVGPGMAIFFSRLIFGAVRSDPVTVRMPRLDMFFNFPEGNLSLLNVSVTVIIAIVLVIAMFIFLYKTKWGLRVIAIGENPAAADTLGVNVNLTRFVCVLVSGVLAGFGGAAFTLSIVPVFAPNVIAGSGFIALAAVIFGKWSPHGLLGACLIFGFLQALTILLRDLPIPLHAITILPYVLTLIILVMFVGKSVAPKAVGVPYGK